MRKGFLGSLTALLAGTSLAFTQPPATSDPAAAGAPNGTGQSTTVTAPHDASAPFVEGPRSPYWPNPLGKYAAPAFGLPPAPHDGVGEEKPHGQLFIWGSAEYLLWWVKNQPLAVPLVTSGSQATQGILGSPDTAVLLGGSDLDYHTFSGGRFTLGIGFGTDYNCNWGVEGSGFFVEKRPAGLLASSSVIGVPVLARPIVNALDGTETVALVAFPTVAAGRVAVSSNSDVYGWDVDVVHGFYRDGPLHVDLLGGFRYLVLDENLDIAQNSVLLAGGTAGFAGNALVPPNTVSILDHFGTRNEFYGAQLGGRVEYARERLVVSALGKIALGSVHEVVDLSGFTSRSGPGTVAGIAPGGLLVVSSNSGRRAHDEFAAIPEIGVNVGYQISHSLRVFMGYTFLYFSDVARPGEQINRTVNPQLVPASQTFQNPMAMGPAQPSFTFQRTDFWAQGLNFGLQFRF